jgi:TldD protein
MSEKKAIQKFYEDADLTLSDAQAMVVAGLEGADFGELYVEKTVSESLAKDNGQYTEVSVGNSRDGFGFRAGQGARVGYAFSDAFNRAALKNAVAEARQVLADDAPQNEGNGADFGRIDRELYTQEASLDDISLEDKIRKIDALEAYAKGLDGDITNVTISYSNTIKDVHIITADGQALAESRPRATLRIGVQVTDADGKTEQGEVLVGGAVSCTEAFNEQACQEAAQKAVTIAKTLLVAEEAPAGVMDVVIAPGWGGVLLHEATGHGLEGDFTSKGSSVYSNKIGEKVAHEAVTVVDQGDMPGERGSLHFDDEGLPTQKNVLIEDGVLKGYMQDRQNAQAMGAPPTGNGRRESYEHLPMPRMTNTYFAAGPHTPEEIVASVKDGLYISNMGGGQVDITSGKFNMNATLAWRIRDGKIGEPVKGAVLVGDGETVIRNITMVGNDLDHEKAAGMCGKNGQFVPVSVGQPTIRVAKMTIGGSK